MKKIIKTSLVMISLMGGVALNADWYCPACNKWHHSGPCPITNKTENECIEMCEKYDAKLAQFMKKYEYLKKEYWCVHCHAYHNLICQKTGEMEYRDERRLDVDINKCMEEFKPLMQERRKMQSEWWCDQCNQYHTDACPITHKTREDLIRANLIRAKTGFSRTSRGQRLQKELNDFSARPFNGTAEEERRREAYIQWMQRAINGDAKVTQ
ncbi:MAG: hypothetical protein LBE99_03030 [Puniceicoccales bacterium]|jgi:hypothetical protein|nr:hypothetical protein [Puniceicoccales bacterium]